MKHAGETKTEQPPADVACVQRACDKGLRYSAAMSEDLDSEGLDFSRRPFVAEPAHAPPARL